VRPPGHHPFSILHYQFLEGGSFPLPSALMLASQARPPAPPLRGPAPATPPSQCFYCHRAVALCSSNAPKHNLLCLFRARFWVGGDARIQHGTFIAAAPWRFFQATPPSTTCCACFGRGFGCPPLNSCSFFLKSELLHALHCP
jgi:hypothetical protein